MLRQTVAIRILASALAATLLLAGTARSAEEPALSGYTCCNLHYDKDWISDANWSSLAMLPAGAAIKTTGYGRYRIMAEIDGRKMRFGLDYGRQQSLPDWARKLIVQQDPRPKIAAWSAPVRNAIRDGKVTIGMTKEQVLVAVGYPPMHQTPSLDALQWKYWHTSFGSYLLVWDGSGRLKDVLADPQTRYGVLHEPGK